MATALIALALGIQAITPVAKFDAGRGWEHLRQLVAIGPRPSGSQAIEQTRVYIKAQLAAAGLTAVDQAWDDQTPIDRVHMVNLAVTIPGARKDRIVFAGHYDTKIFREFRFVGASDGVRMVSVGVTIPGAPKDRIVSAGHYDTKLFREFRFVGASDGGSSAAFL